MVEGRLADTALGTQRFRVYVPPGYRPTGKRRYPVIYLLPGSGADETQWDDVGISEGADCLLAAHRIRPALIVLLDADIGDHRAAAERRVERFVLSDALPAIDHRFRTLADRAHRAIGGISLGGGWSLQIAADHPDLFSAVGGHSPWPALASRQQASLTNRRLRVWLDVGSSDGLRIRVVSLERVLADHGGDMTFRVWPGVHDRRYWSRHVQDYLRFYAARW